MDTVLVAREFLRAVRGRRSQPAFSRRLGYASNVAAKWEAGRRMPTAAEALRACRRVGIDAPSALSAFRPALAELLGRLGDAELASWLAAQRGRQTVAAIAARAGCSRFRAARFLSGATRPRLPEFFALVQALTGRLTELVAGLVPIERVPSLFALHRQVSAARRAAFDQPWSSAVLALLATGRFQPPARSAAAAIARILGIAEPDALAALSLLREAGVLVQRQGEYQVRSGLIVDTRDAPSATRALHAHWGAASLSRLAAPAAADLFSYNVLAVSRADFDRLRRLQFDFFQQVRALAAESEPSEVAGLMVLHLMQWDPGEL